MARNRCSSDVFCVYFPILELPFSLEQLISRLRLAIHGLMLFPLCVLSFRVPYAPYEPHGVSYARTSMHVVSRPCSYGMLISYFWLHGNLGLA